jgi:hypothetical protein
MVYDLKVAVVAQAVAAAQQWKKGLFADVRLRFTTEAQRR